MKDRLVIAAAQAASAPGDVVANVADHLRFAKTAAEHEVQLLVFPELSLTGYELNLARSHVVPPDSAELDPLRRFASEARMTVVVGAPVSSNEDVLHIAALALRPDGSVSVYTKEHVHESEQHVFTSGLGGAALRINEVDIALAICADAAHPVHAAAAASDGADVYAVGAMITEDAYARKTALLKNYAVEHGMAVLLSNYCGETGGEISAGKSAIWSEEGGVVAATVGNERALVIGVRQNRARSGSVLANSF